MMISDFTKARWKMEKWTRLLLGVALFPELQAIEIYKVVNNIAPEILKGVFPVKENNVYELENSFKTRNVKTETYGIQI